MSTTVIVEDNIPIPATRVRPTKVRHVLHTMQIGQSYFTPETDKDFAAVSSSARATAKRAGVTVDIHRWTEPDGTEGTRVWRIA